MKHLTIAYMTCRQDPMFEWFFDSLHRETGGDYTDIRVVVVDFYANQLGRKEEVKRKSRVPVDQLIHTTPKPTVWQGEHKLCKRDYFAASNARNTAVCYAPDGYIAYLDDVSVILPGWLKRIREAADMGIIVFGAYRKVFKLKVESGDVVSFDEANKRGMDSRLDHIPDKTERTKTTGGWLFGCSLAMPVSCLLAVNGWDEACDSTGAEDYPLGHMLEKAGFQLYYDPLMMTYESEELHFINLQLSRVNKLNVMGHPDSAHAHLHMLRNGRDIAPNYFGDGGLAGERQKVLNGEPFTVVQIPQHDWRDGQPICEM